VTPVVLDTDVASALLKERLPGSLVARLSGRPLAITFVTVGELTQWTFIRHSTSSSHVVVLPYSLRVAAIWGRIRPTLNSAVVPDPSRTVGPRAASPANSRATGYGGR
jgi:predicted nucleic acid-binding protein